MPEEEMPNHFVLQGSAEEKLAEGTLNVRLKLDSLHQLEQVHDELVVS